MLTNAGTLAKWGWHRRGKQYYNERLELELEDPDVPVVAAAAGGVTVVATAQGRLFTVNGGASWDLSAVDREFCLRLLARSRGYVPEATDGAGQADQATIEADQATDLVEDDPAEEQGERERTFELSEPEEDPRGFHQLLDDRANPALAWEAQRDHLAQDARYDLVDGPHRPELFEEWRRSRQHSPTDFVRLVHAHYRPDMFYLEFKRKHRKKPEFNTSLTEKEREQAYREYAALVKKTPQERAAMEATGLRRLVLDVLT